MSGKTMRQSAQPTLLEAPRTRSTLREHDIQRLILDWLRIHRIFHWRNNTGAMRGTYKSKPWFVRFGIKGAPDIFVVHQGKCIGIEVKDSDGEQSQAQREFQTSFEHAGGIYVLARSLEDVYRAIGTR